MKTNNTNNSFEEEVNLAYEILKQVLVSPINIYTKDPDLYDKLQGVIETLEYSLFTKSQK